MYKTIFRERILEIAEPYYKILEKDFSHNRHHFFRVEFLAKKIAIEEKADIEVVEAAALLFDIARYLEDTGEIQDHAEESAIIARHQLHEIGFPKEKIENVCHSILVHRRSKNRTPETIEAKILIDADYIDAMGAVDICRVIASSLTSRQYRKPIYNGKPLKNGNISDSALHFLAYKLNHPKHNPEKFYTNLGRTIAKQRYKYMKGLLDNLCPNGCKILYASLFHHFPFWFS
mgnify:CR=1 FL=1